MSLFSCTRTRGSLAISFVERNLQSTALNGIITRSGFLGKLSGGKHHTPKWDNRYFELTDTGYLNYYKKADGGKPINSIYLRGCPLEIDPNDPLIVLIKTDDRDWSLRAATAEEAYAWKEAMSFYTDKRN